MNYKPIIRFPYLCLPLFMVSIFNFSCKDDVPDLGIPATASFKVSKVEGKANTFLLESTSENAFRYQWDIGTEEGLKGGTATKEAYFLKKGKYNVKLYAHGKGGYDIATQEVNVENDDLTPILTNPIFVLLTSHPWKLDANSSSPIIVGTENNPGEYFGGGPLADCQTDDVYTFAFANNDFKLSYNANGATFNAGNLQPNYVCGADRSYNNVSFTFSTIVAGAGVATITLPGAPIPNFIGVTDISSNNFRIISITENEMVLRSGKATEVVHQMRFVRN
jgi:hypothetical protein